MFERALLLAIPVIALLAGVASAQDYPVDSTGGSLTPAGDVVVAAEGFIPGAVVHYRVEFTPEEDEQAFGVLGGYEGEVAFGPLRVASLVEEGTTVAAADGSVDLQVTGRGAGSYVVTMTDGTNTKVASVAVTAADIAAATGSGSPAAGSGAGSAGSADSAGAGTLPNTGSDGSLPLAGIGTALVAGGAVVAFAARRRRRSAA